MHTTNPAVATEVQAARSRGGTTANWRRFGPDAGYKWDFSTPESRARCLEAVAHRMFVGSLSRRRGEAIIRAIRSVDRYERRLERERRQAKPVVVVRVKDWAAPAFRQSAESVEASAGLAQ